MKLREFIYIAVIFLLCGVAYNFWQTSRESRAAYKAETEQTRIWRDKAGQSVAEATIVKSDYALFKATHEKLVDSLKKEIGGGKVSSVVTITRTVTDTVTVTKDSRGLISGSDRWTKVWQPVSGRLAFSVYDSLTVTSFNKHYGFLGLKTKAVTQIINSNPHVTMLGARSYEIAPPDRRVGLGAMVGYGVSNRGLSPFVGVGLFYRIF